MRNEFHVAAARSAMTGRALKFGLLTLVAGLILHDCAKAQSSPTPDCEKWLLKEVLELRSELLRFLIKAQQQDVQAIEVELAHLNEEERQSQQAEEQRAQQVAQIEEQLAGPYLEAETRPEVEAVKQNLSGEAAEKLQTEQSKLQQRKAALSARLADEQAQLHLTEQQAAQVQRALAH
jgi:hypothetical protein